MSSSAPQTEAKASTRSPRRTIIGTVISDKMAKTVTVRVSRKVKHPTYGKFITRHVTHKAHDEAETAKAGDIVEIAFARRLSKTKHWRLVRIVSAARVVAVRGEEEIASLPGKVAPAPKAASATAVPAGTGAAAPASGGAPEVSS